MATNPFLSDPEKAEVFELGYLAGFQDPAGDDNVFRPLSPELFDIFVQGADAGRQDAQSPPAGDISKIWIPKSDLAFDGESSSDEALEHLLVFTIFKLAEVLTEKIVLGLVDLVITVLGIQGNVSSEQLQPLTDGFSEPYRGFDVDSLFYIAACPRTDHRQVEVGVTENGLWSGSGTHDFKDALRDVMRHEHREAVIIRCDVQGSTCSVVWIAQDKQ